MTLLVRSARAVIGDGTVLPRADVRIEGASIATIAPRLEPVATDVIMEAEGRVLMPGFVDAHTHTLWCGDRLDEFELKLEGASYLDVLKSGGGIWSTVRSVRAATRDELASLLRQRLQLMLELGTTTVEVKSGYGLSTEHELKMLRAIRDAAASFPGTVVPTALLGHALDPADPHFVRRTIEETLPAVHAEFPDVAIDAYCEEGAWSVDECRALFGAAERLGHPLRLHVDQFHPLGGVELALELRAQSVDHLEATSAETLTRIAQSGMYGVMLPAACFHLGTPYANGRSFVDAGGKLVLASNYNPGSSPTYAIPFVLALGVRKLGLRMSEAITAVTRNAAELLCLRDRGLIRDGMRADLLLLRHHDERQLAFELATNPVARVICGGELVG